MKKYNIRIEQKAFSDMDEIIAYLSEFDYEVAAKQIERIFEAMDSLEHFPFRGRKIGLIGKNVVRQVNVGRYKIAYIVSGDYVAVHRVVHMKMNVEFDYPNTMT